MQKFPLHLPHKVFLARSSRLPLAVPGWSDRARLVDLLISSKCLQAFPIHFSPSPLARSLDDCHHVQCPQWIISSVAASCRFSFSFSLLCVCVCVCVLLLLIFPALHWQLRPFVMRVLLLVWSLLSAYLLNHLVAHTCTHICMYQYVEQPLISHLSWRFINSRLKINWNFIHLIILFTRSLFALFMNQYCGIHLNCMWL